MNQQIRFRAWDVYKEMFIPTDVWAVICTDFGAIGIMLKDWEDYREGEYFYKNTQIVDQFTGLTDKNGKEIYCGDILKGVSYNTFSKGQSDNYEVIWGVDGWHIKGTYFSIQELRNYCNNDIEIIGNIHQNSK